MSELSRPGARATKSREIRLAEYDAQIADSKRKSRRHSLFAVLGLSPAALLPILGLGMDFGPEVAVAASVFVTGIESWRAVQARADQREAEEGRRRLLHDGGDPEP
jgi:hypothetical protein